MTRRHAIHRVSQFSIVAPYTLSLQFSDGTTRRIDCRPVLEGQLFGPLKDVAVFNAVTLDSRLADQYIEHTTPWSRSTGLAGGLYGRPFLF